MNSNRAPKQAGAKSEGRGRELSELRRSGAAGLHVKYRKDRSNTRRKAIKAEREAG